MPLGTQVNVSPGDVVLERIAAPPLKLAQLAPSFRPITGCVVPPASVNGDWLSQLEIAIFNPLQNRHTLTDRQKIRHR